MIWVYVCVRVCDVCVCVCECLCVCVFVCVCVCVCVYVLCCALSARFTKVCWHILYITACIDIHINVTGHRKSHNFEIIRADPKMTSLIDGTGTKTKTSGTAGGRFASNVVEDPQSTAKKANPKDWEEFYDANAKAKYWFNKLTGEASWINPHVKKI